MIELLNRRTRSSKVYHIGTRPNGRPRFSLDSVIGALHYQENPRDSKAPWLDIDTKIQPDGSLRTAPYDLDIFQTGMPGFAYKSKDSGEFYLRLRGIREVGSLTTISPQLVVPTIQGNRVIWSTPFPFVDLEVVAQNTQVMFRFIIKNAAAAQQFPSRKLEIVYDFEETPGQAKYRCKARQAARGPLAVNKVLGALELREQLDLSGLAFPVIVDPAIDDQVAANGDDWNCKYNPATQFTAGAATIQMAFHDGWWVYTVDAGYRFDCTAISQGDTIDVAYLEYRCAWGEADGGQVNIYGVRAADPAAPANAVAHNALTLTTASVMHDFGADVTDTWYQLAGMVGPTQEVVTNHEPVHMIFICRGIDTGEDQQHYAYGHDDVPANATKVHIEYTSGGGAVFPWGPQRAAAMILSS